MEEINTKIPDFNKQEWLNEELAIKGIYLRWKTIKAIITWNGTYTVACWFAPKVILASCQDSTECSDGSSDFTLSFSIRKYNNLGAFNTSESTNLVNLSSMVVVPAKRLYNWFTITVSSFSGWTKNIYFTCYS